MDRDARRRLRDELRRRYPWVEDADVGPSAVEAGECDGCGQEARLVQTCGPGVGVYLGRGCTGDAGDDAWCEGHRAEGAAATVALRALPEEADTVARLWWVATGEVTLDPRLRTAMGALHLGQRH